ncbi:MAG TPA: hypothetical protein PLG14_09200, partial [Spirochaetales bacterium]|nr:hypothetical protein [Spirochaetales bacterium]
MEDTGKRRLAAAAVALAGLVYFFVCARPLPKALVLEPRWARTLGAASGEQAAPAAGQPRPAASTATAAASSVAPAAGAPVAAGSAGLAAAAPLSASPQGGFDADSGWIPYRIAGNYGYFDEEGKVALKAASPFGVALAKGAYVAYDRLPESLLLRSASGRELARVAEAGYPFFSAGRLFVMRPGQSSVAEIGPDGKALWSRDFPSIVTAFDASPGLALFGLMDGSLVGVGADGAELLSFAPGGSRVAGVYGCAVSPDGLMAAAVTGLDRQRLVVLERRSSAFRVTYHRWLESDFRRQVSMAFTEDGRYLAYEIPSGLGVYDREKRAESKIASAALSGVGL